LSAHLSAAQIKARLDHPIIDAFGYASTRPARVIGDNVEPSGFERAEDGPIHHRAIHAQVGGEDRGETARIINQ